MLAVAHLLKLSEFFKVGKQAFKIGIETILGPNKGKCKSIIEKRSKTKYSKYSRIGVNKK